MGCRPASAAPTVRPAKPDSVMGESMTLFSPKRSRRPFVTLYLHAVSTSPMTKHCQQLQEVLSKNATTSCLSHSSSSNGQSSGSTYAPLYCATSSPSTNTLSFASISSAMASFRASRTVISFWPVAYDLRANDGVRAGARNAGRKAARREAGRRSRAAAIVV
jgi:hypothetical protein